jgi:hypothetical protein
MKFIGKSLLLTAFGGTCFVLGGTAALLLTAVGVGYAFQKDPKLQKPFTDALSESIADIVAPNRKKDAKVKNWRESRLRIVEDYANGKTGDDK